MRRFLISILTFIGMVLGAVGQEAEYVVVDGVRYRLEARDGDYTALVAGFSGPPISTTVPESVTYNDVDYTVVGTISNLLKGGMFEIQSIVFPETMTSIGSGCFWGCKIEGLMKLPNSLKEIGMCSFTNISGPGELILPESIDEIPWLTFTGMNVKLVIPSGIKHFAGHSMMSLGVIPDYDFRNGRYFGSGSFKQSVLEEVAFSDGVTFGKGAFSSSKSLYKIDLPEEYTVSEGGAFTGCVNLMRVTSLAPQPPTTVDLETGQPTEGLVINVQVPDGCVLYVPQGSKSAYSKSPAWSNFKIIREIDPAGIEDVEEDAASTDRYEIWNMAGYKVADKPTRQEAVAGLPSGIYILRTDAKTEKIIL